MVQFKKDKIFVEENLSRRYSLYVSEIQPKLLRTSSGVLLVPVSWWPLSTLDLQHISFSVFSDRSGIFSVLTDGFNVSNKNRGSHRYFIYQILLGKVSFTTM